MITDQRNGLLDSRAATLRKREVRRAITAMPIAHLAQIGALAARKQHELGKTFRFGRRPRRWWRFGRRPGRCSRRPSRTRRCW